MVIGDGWQGHDALVGADQAPAALVRLPVMGPADRDKIGEISRAALRPVAEVVPVNAQMLSSGRLPHIATVSPPERQRCRVATLAQSPKPDRDQGLPGASLRSCAAANPNR
jgi:hypothetical protein